MAAIVALVASAPRAPMPGYETGELVSRERWTPPPLDVSLTRPKLDATVILTPSATSSQPKKCPLLALASLNSATAPSAEVSWSQLLALSLAEEGEPVITVGRHADCGVTLSDPRVSIKHFEIVARHRATDGGSRVHGDSVSSKDALVCECFLKDLSSNGTAVNGTVIGKGNSKQLQTGDKICVLPANRVGDDKSISFLFRNSTESLVTPEGLKKLEMQDLLSCPICIQVIYKCVSLMPCAHIFCMACCSDLMHTSRRNNCPVCRRSISAVMKNHPMDEVIEAFLEVSPDCRRSTEEICDMDARDKLRLGASGKLVRDVCCFEPSSRSLVGTGVVFPLDQQRPSPRPAGSVPPPTGAPAQVASSTSSAPATNRTGSTVCLVQ